MDIDHLDRKILKQLQISSDISLDRLGEMIGLSCNAVWRRVRALATAGVITRRVALVDPENWILVCWCSIKSKQRSIRSNGPSNWQKPRRASPKLLAYTACRVIWIT